MHFLRRITSIAKDESSVAHSGQHKLNVDHHRPIIGHSQSSAIRSHRTHDPDLYNTLHTIPATTYSGYDTLCTSQTSTKFRPELTLLLSNLSHLLLCTSTLIQLAAAPVQPHSRHVCSHMTLSTWQ